MWHFSRKGFTLIEILVVVAIIGVLTSIMTVNFSKVRGDARNKTVKTSLSEMQLSLAVYKAQNGQYPAVPNVGLPCAQDASNPHYSDSTQCGIPYVVGLTPDFIAALPSQTMSGNASCKFVYRVASDHSYYKLTAENCFAGATAAANGILTEDEFARCPSSCSFCNGSTFNAAYKASTAFYTSMAVYSAGGECL